MRWIIYAAMAGIVFSSCGTQRKMNDAHEKLASVKKEQEKENSKLNAVAGTAGSKLQQGKIDTNINFLIGRVLQKQQGNAGLVEKDIAAIDSLLADKKQFRKNYKSFILPLLDSLQRKTALYTQNRPLYGMVEDVLNIANYELFELAAFFGPGKYIIPDDKIDTVMKSFAPIIDSIIAFSNRYSEVSRTATLVILGFADGTGFSPEGPLLDTLTALTGKKEVSKEELNLALSELRAQELSKQLTKLFLQKAAAFVNFEKLRIDYIHQGKGEEFPLSYIKDYMTDDSRRRIVLCYWAVLPD